MLSAGLISRKGRLAECALNEIKKALCAASLLSATAMHRMKCRCRSKKIGWSCHRRFGQQDADIL